MPRNLSGVYTLPAGNPVVPGTTIDANWANSTLQDISNELTNSLSRTGAGGMLAPFRIDDGNVTGPGLSFLNETNTGYYRLAAGSTAFSILGVNTLQMNTTAVTVPNTRTLNAQGNALVGGTFGVTGAATFASTLAVTGAITATGGVLGNVTAAAGTSSFNDVTISGSLDMVAGSSATITGLSNPTNASDAANKSYVDTQVATRLALAGGTMSGAIAMGTNKITGLGTPTADQDAATKAYVDSVAQGLDIKASCRAATTGNITLSGTQTIDGVAVIAGDRVLVKNQSSAAENGIYVAAVSTWSRAADANTWDELVGAFTFIEDGSTSDNSGWVCTVAPGGTLGVTAVTFDQFSGAGQVNAGTGMTKTGNTLNVNTASSSRIVVGADEIDLATTGVTAGTYKSVTVDQWGRITAGTNPTTLAGYGISDAYTQTQTDSLLAGKLSLSGGTMTGTFSMGGYRITSVADPVNAQDAATKNYIDTIFGSTTSAAASAAAAASSASSASSSASSASSSASSASTSATNAATSLFNFRAQYLGPLASNPTVDGNGNPVAAGDLYYNTVANEMRVYNGSTWLAAYIPATGYLPLTGGTMTGTINFAAGQTISGYLTTATAASTYSALASANTFTTNQTITANTSTDALRITQTGSGNALYIEDVAADATPFVVSSTGAVGIGTTTPDNVTSAGIALVSNDGFYPQVVNRNKSNDTTASYLVFDKDRAGAIVQNGDSLGNILFRSFDGTNYLQSAAIIGYSDAAPGTNDVPGRLTFLTTADGAAAPTERFRIANTGAWGLSGANYGTSGQVLTSNGSGAAPTWQTASAGGSITATATGSISNGAAVAVNSDGTVSAVATTVIPLSAGTPATVGSPSAPPSFTCQCAVNSSTVVAFTRSNANGYFVGVVGTASGSSITWGSHQTITTTNIYYASCAYLASVDRICVYAWDGDNSQWIVFLISRSGNTLSLVTSSSPWGAGTTGNIQSGCAFDAGNTLYTVSSNGSYALEVSRLAISSSSIALQSSTTFGNDAYGNATSIAFDPSTGNFVVTYTDGSNYGVARLITSSSTGPKVTFLSGSTGDPVPVYVPSIQKIVVVLRNSSVAGSAFAAVTANISGSTLTFGSVQNLSTSVGGIYGINVTWDSTVNVILVTCTSGAGNSVLSGTISFSGTTPIVGAALATLLSTSLSTSYNNQALVYLSGSAKSALIYNTTGSGSPPSTWRSVMVTAPGNIFNTQFFIGFSSAAYTNGQTATVNVVGGSNSSQAGLTAGTKYYVQNDGTLSSTATTQPYAGIALSATRILVRG